MGVRATSRRRRSVFAVLFLSVPLAGCITGERPTLASAPGVTGDAAVDAVLSRVEDAAAATFTADYELVARLGNVTTPARVVQEGRRRRSVTMGRVRFLSDGGSMTTCQLDTGQCSEGINAALVSNTQLAPEFYGASAAARLRRDVEVRTGPTAASTETIAGQPATCVAVPVAEASSSTYCVLNSGVLARLDAADVTITMTSYSPEPDESAFTQTG